MNIQSKAVAGGIAANLAVIATWAMSLIPGWAGIPDTPKAAMVTLVSTVIGAVVVYFSPSNSQSA